MTKVLITSIPVQDITRPPGILSILAGCCELINAEYDVLDLNLHMYRTLDKDLVTKLINDFSVNKFRSPETESHYDIICDYFINYIINNNPTHLAISVFTYISMLATEHLLRRIKDANISVTIILGGLGISSIKENSTTPFGDYCLHNKLADYCIYGEGEVAFVELLKGNDSYPGINNHNEKQLLDLDILPMPAYHKINPADYFYATAPEVLVTGSRGCVRDCSFCNVGHYWSKYVYKSGKRMAKEIFNIWKTTGVNKFDFSDSLINGSIKSFREFNKELISYRNQFPDFNPLYKGQFICRPQGQLKEKDYQEMALAGAETIVVGIESFSPAVRKHMNKDFSNEDIDLHYEYCARYGIKNVLLLLTGYVTETAEDHQFNLEYIKRYQLYALSRIIYAINIEIDGLGIDEGTPLHGMIDELGIIFLPGTTPKKNWISLKNKTLTPHQRLRRGLEICNLAHNLGYSILHFNQKIDYAEQEYNKLQSKTYSEVFSIEKI